MTDTTRIDADIRAALDRISYDPAELPHAEVGYAIYRAGMLRAAEICDAIGGDRIAPWDAAITIRAEAQRIIE